MKTSKKALSLLLAFAVAIGCLLTTGETAQAAPKTTTYTYDAKMGVAYQTALRHEVQSRFGSDLMIYLANEGDYVATIKTSSPSLIAKQTRKYTLKENSFASGPDLENTKDVRFKSYCSIEFFAAKEGKYTVTFTIKNKKNKVVGKKKVTVYATSYFDPIEYLSYAGAQYYGSDIQTTKASGKVKYKANKTFKIKSISVGKYNADGTISYKKIKNNAKIKLETKTAYTEEKYSYDSGYGDYKYSYKSVQTHDYIKPVTFVQIAYYDQYLKIDSTKTYSIFNVK